MAKTILFSGRFDNVHLGHILTLQRLARRYQKVIVCILDYPAQFHPIEERKATMEKALQGCKGNFEVVVNRKHFADIFKEELESIPAFDVYGSGNAPCVLRMNHLGYETEAVNRTPGYNASDSVKYQKLMKFLDDEGFLK